MTIEAIPAIVGPTALAVAQPTDTTAPNTDFASKLSASLETLQRMQDNADNLSVEAATGRLTDVHDYIIAATEAALATQLTVAVRNKALDAFNEIMRMQA
jgi:flagellar hook-basal body complex protein FliE